MFKSDSAGNNAGMSAVTTPKSPASRSGKRLPLKTIAVVTLLALAATGYAWHARSGRASLMPIGMTELATVTRGDVEKSVESSGKVQSNLDVDIKCRASGEVVKLPFDISETVKKGDLLCQLDPTDENLAVQLAEASVAQSTAKYEQAKQNYEQAELNLQTTRERDEATLESAKVKAANLAAKADRQRQLIDQKLGSQEDFETAQTDAAVAKSDARAAEMSIEELKQLQIALDFKKQDVNTAAAQLSADKISLDTQKRQLGYTTVTAPIDGTVSALDVQLGSIVASGTGGFSGGTTILTLSDLSHIYVMATVDESDIGAVRVDQPVKVTVDSFPGQVFVGKVVRIAVTGVNSSNVVTFEVKVEVLDPHKDLLKPQMTGNVTIVQQSREHVLTVPAGAVTHRSGKTFVQTADAQMHEVTLGLNGAESVEVLSGVTEGEKVLVSTTELPSAWKSDSRGGP